MQSWSLRAWGLFQQSCHWLENKSMDWELPVDGYWLTRREPAACFNMVQGKGIGEGTKLPGCMLWCEQKWKWFLSLWSAPVISDTSVTKGWALGSMAWRSVCVLCSVFAKLLGADGTLGNDVQHFFIELRNCRENPGIPSGQPLLCSWGQQVNLLLILKMKIKHFTSSLLITLKVCCEAELLRFSIPL